MHELIPPVVNFLILVGVLAYVLRKPLKEMIATRRNAIKSQIDEAQAQKLEADRRYREFSEKLSAFEAEAKSVLDRANTEAEALRAKIIKDAQVSAERIIREAEATAAANAQDYKDQIRRETIAKAVELAERVIREALSKDDQRRIVHEYVGKVQSQ